MVGRGDNEQFCSDIELDFLYFMQDLCTITIKPIHTMEKDQIIVDFLSFLESKNLLATYFQLTAEHHPAEGVIRFLNRVSPDSFIDSAFLWPDGYVGFWIRINRLWNKCYTKKFTR